MRDGGDIERLGVGFGLSRATAYRHHREALDLMRVALVLTQFEHKMIWR